MSFFKRILAAPSNIDRDEEIGDRVKFDTDERWFNNPQFRITVNKPVKSIIISLMQADEKMTGHSYVPCDFLIIRAKVKPNC
jgi:calpain, invertebrate